MSQYVVVTPQGDRFGPTDFQTLVRWASEGRVAPTMTVEDVLSGQTMTASSVPGLFAEGAPMDVAPYMREPQQTGRRSAGVTAMIIGILGMVAWCLPIVGLPVGITAIILGARSLQNEDRTQALIGLVLGIACVLLSIASAVLGTLFMNSLNLKG